MMLSEFDLDRVTEEAHVLALRAAIVANTWVVTANAREREFIEALKLPEQVTHIHVSLVEADASSAADCSAVSPVAAESEIPTIQTTNAPPALDATIPPPEAREPVLGRSVESVEHRTPATAQAERGPAPHMAGCDSRPALFPSPPKRRDPKGRDRPPQRVLADAQRRGYQVEPIHGYTGARIVHLVYGVPVSIGAWPSMSGALAALERIR